MFEPINTQNYLSLEGFFEKHFSEASGFLGARAGQYAWSLKDADPRKEDAERACKIVQSSVESAVGARKADWVILTSESHEVLSLEAWVDQIVYDAHKEALTLDTGYSDLDLNVETQLVCGRQLEAFHEASWAKARLQQMFSPDNFMEEEPLASPFKMPLPHLIDKMDRDLEIVVKGGMRHPYKCSIGVAALYLRVAADESGPEQMIPVLRRVRTNDIGAVISQMKDELGDRFKGLVETIKEKQDILRLLPDGWPTQSVWESMQDWSTRRYLGDNGLVGSDFFDGKWLISDLPSDVHRKNISSAPVEVGGLDLAARVIQRRASQSKVESVGPVKPVHI